MVLPTTDTPTEAEPNDPCDVLACELRAIYAEAFAAAHAQAVAARDRFESPAGVGTIDPSFAADTAACRAVNAELAGLVDRHFPGAKLVGGIDEPAVIDSQWLHDGRLIIIIDWSYDVLIDFGDPSALTVTEVTR